MRMPLAYLGLYSLYAATTPQPRLNLRSTCSADDRGMPSTRRSDIELSCSCCGGRFVYSAGEQELLAIRGVNRQPRACPTCRKLPGHV
jgi:Probable zinc-ribbon domain